MRITSLQCSRAGPSASPFSGCQPIRLADTPSLNAQRVIMHATQSNLSSEIINLREMCALGLVAAAQAVALVALSAAAPPPALANTENFTFEVRPAEGRAGDDDYFETVPQGLSSTDDDSKPKGPRLGSLLEGPKGKEIQQCARKCVPTCIRGGQGAPGLGPMSVRKEIVVFKDGYRSRNYCLSECIQVCSLSINPAPPVAAAAATTEASP